MAGTLYWAVFNNIECKRICGLLFMHACAHACLSCTHLCPHHSLSLCRSCRREQPQLWFDDRCVWIADKYAKARLDAAGMCVRRPGCIWSAWWS